MKKSKIRPECNMRAFFERRQRRLQNQESYIGEGKIESSIKANITYGDSMWNPDLVAGTLIEFYTKKPQEENSLLDFFDSYIANHRDNYGVDYDVIFTPNGDVADLQVNDPVLLHQFIKRFVELDKMKVTIDKKIKLNGKYDANAQKIVAEKLVEMKQVYEQNQSKNLDKAI